MRLLLSMALAMAAASPAAAAINAPVPTNAYITFGGVDWAWASPCDAEGAGSCGVIDLSYQGTQGWRVAVAADFANAPIAGDFVFPGANLNGLACASAWFTNYSHCDYEDGVAGKIWNKPGNIGQGDCCHETWVVRDLSGAVPEPASWAMLIAGFGLVGATMRRRAAVAA